MARYRHINVQVRQDLYDEFRSSIPWGMRVHLFGAMLRLLMGLVREHGWERALADLMSGEYELRMVHRSTADPNSIKLGDK